MKKLDYLCLQATRQGQASYAHVNEIIKGLKARNWQVNLYEPVYTVQRPGIWQRISSFWSIQKRLRNNGTLPDILYIRSHFAAFPTAIWARNKKIPVIQEINGPYEDLFLAWPWTRYLAPLFKWLARKQWQWADACIVVTPELKSWLIGEIGSADLFIIPNGANTELFNPNADNSLSLPEPYVVFFGALAVWQGVDLILKALKLPDWPADLHFVACGDGPARQQLEAAAIDDTRIIYLGSVPYLEISGIISHSLAGLCPKNNKGERSKTGLSPLKVYETLACGVPVIVSNFPGQADLVKTNKCGLIISPDNPHELLEAVKYLYSHRQEAHDMGQRGRSIIESEHSWDQRAKQTEEVIDFVLNQVKKEKRLV